MTFGIAGSPAPPTLSWAEVTANSAWVLDYADVARLASRRIRGRSTAQSVGPIPRGTQVARSTSASRLTLESASRPTPSCAADELRRADGRSGRSGARPDAGDARIPRRVGHERGAPPRSLPGPWPPAGRPSVRPAHSRSRRSIARRDRPAAQAAKKRGSIRVPLVEGLPPTMPSKSVAGVLLGQTPSDRPVVRCCPRPRTRASASCGLDGRVDVRSSLLIGFLGVARVALWPSVEPTIPN